MCINLVVLNITYICRPFFFLFWNSIFHIIFVKHSPNNCLLNDFENFCDFQIKCFDRSKCLDLKPKRNANFLISCNVTDFQLSIYFSEDFNLNFRSFSKLSFHSLLTTATGWSETWQQSGKTLKYVL